MSRANSDETDDGPELSEMRAVRLTPGTDARFEEYRDRHGYTNSEALRAAIRDGLDADTDDTLRDRATSALALLLVTGYPTWAAANGRLTLAAGYIAFLMLAAFFKPQLEHIWSQFTGLLPG